MNNKKKSDLKLIPEKKFGELVTAITRVPKPKSEPKAKPKKRARRKS
jgi:hypothetical protein